MNHDETVSKLKQAKALIQEVHDAYDPDKGSEDAETIMWNVLSDMQEMLDLVERKHK